MSNVLWNRILLDEFVRLAELSDIEQDIIKGKMRGQTRVEQSIRLGISLATLDRYVARLKRKYDAVQPYSQILPKRIK